MESTRTRLNDEEENDAEWQRSADDAHDRHASYQSPYYRPHHVEACAPGLSECYFGEEDEEEEAGSGMSVMDAFEDFNLRAQRRMQELLDATDRKLFDANALVDTSNEDAPELPAHVYMSDHFRLSKPPQFQHWQSAFSYLHVAGRAMFSEPSEDYICRMPGAPQSTITRMEGPENPERMPLESLAVFGRHCLTPPDDADEPDEETILIDGLMEEIIVQDYRYDGNDQSDAESDVGQWTSGCASPRSTRILEVVDALTIDCFSTTVAPLMTSFFQTLLQKQQTMLRKQREAAEYASARAIEEQLAVEQAERVCEQLRAVQGAERAAAILKAEKEEAQREAERQELLRQQQRVENDDEEVKIRTLAYSHTREWYQPDKKCFSHRGRQLTYLKPVLTAKEEVDLNNSGSQSLVSKSSTPDAAFSARKPSKKPFSVPQKPNVRAHPGSMKASSKCSGGLRIVRQQQHQRSSSRSPSSSPSPPRSQQSRQRADKGEKRAQEPPRKRVYLPLIRPSLAPEENFGKTSFSRRCSDDSDDGFVDECSMVHSSRPANVYAISPYRISSPTSAAASVDPAKPRRIRKTNRIEKPNID